MSSLPAGFFDDESQQLVAEGVSLKKQSKNIENSLNNEVNIFLNEVFLYYLCNYSPTYDTR